MQSANKPCIEITVWSSSEMTRYIIWYSFVIFFQRHCEESQERLEAQVEVSFQRKMSEFDTALKRSLSEGEQPKSEHTMDDWA